MDGSAAWASPIAAEFMDAKGPGHIDNTPSRPIDDLDLVCWLGGVSSARSDRDLRGNCELRLDHELPAPENPRGHQAKDKSGDYAYEFHLNSLSIMNPIFLAQRCSYGFRITCQASPCSKRVHRASYSVASFVEDTNIDQDRVDVFVPKNFLDRSSIIAAFKQMRREGAGPLEVLSRS